MRNKSDCSSTVWSACILGELTIKGHGKRMGYLNEPTPEIWKHSRWKTSRKHVVRGRPERLRGAVTPLSIFTAAGLLCSQGLRAICGCFPPVIKPKFTIPYKSSVRNGRKCSLYQGGVWSTPAWMFSVTLVGNKNCILKVINIYTPVSPHRVFTSLQ